MSRIDVVKAQLELEHAAKSNYDSNYQHRVSKLEKELAALEAQERKPREITISFNSRNSFATINNDVNFKDDEISIKTITFVEKLPVKVTREMARELNRVYVQSSMFNNQAAPSLWVDVLKAAGIDAEPSND